MFLATSHSREIMYFILGSDGKEYGPVSVAKIQEWIAAGRANLQTKARPSNEAEWRTLGDYPEFAGVTVPAPIPPADAAIPPAAGAVAASAPVAPTGTPAEIAAAFSARSREFDVFSCLSRSFELWKANLLPLVGATLLSMIIQMILGFIPLVSLVNTFFLAGIFTGGLHYYYLGRMRGQPREVGDIFAGFSRALGRLGLTNLLLVGLMIAITLPFFGPFSLAIIKFAIANQGVAHPVLPPLSLGMMGLACVGLIPFLYFVIAWAFAYTLVIDHGLGPWTALEVSRRVITRHWFSMFGLMICAGILALLGLLGLIIGFIFTLPLALGSILYAYEDLCGPPAA